MFENLHCHNNGEERSRDTRNDLGDVENRGTVNADLSFLLAKSSATALPFYNIPYCINTSIQFGYNSSLPCRFGTNKTYLNRA